MEMIHIDGSQGEGGGQMLRTAVGLSALTGVPVTLDHIRARRPKPGLMRQHLTAVKAAATLCGAQVEGAEPGSGRLVFRPGPLTAGEHHFAVGTAGSATLVCHTILPALLRAPGPSRVVFEGGTHNPMAPSFECLAEALLPLLARMGAEVKVGLDRPGFAPAGGGAFWIEVQPCAHLRPLDLFDRGDLLEATATVYLANLPFDIARRELDTLRTRLDLPEAAARPRMLNHARGPGNAVEVRARCAALTEVFVAYGERGVPAESVALKAALVFEAWRAAGVAVGPHLADQLIVPLAMAVGDAAAAGEGPSSCGFSTLRPTLHTRTQAALVTRFLPVRVGLAPDGPVPPASLPLPPVPTERWRAVITSGADS